MATKKTTSASTGVLFRRADTGTITTEKYAKAHPKTTERETFKKTK